MDIFSSVKKEKYSNIQSKILIFLTFYLIAFIVRHSLELFNWYTDYHSTVNKLCCNEGLVDKTVIFRKLGLNFLKILILDFTL